MTCTSCTGACCYLDGGSLDLSPNDIERLGAAWVEEHAPGGHVRIVDVSQLVGVPGARGCIALRADGCSVYERRPDQCRAFPSNGCALYRPDPRKLAGLITLRVPTR